MIAAATAPNTPAGANHITKSVTFSITGTRSLMKDVTVFAGSVFSDAIANPKKHENTRICRISLVAIASKKLRGKDVRDELAQVEPAGLQVGRHVLLGQRQSEIEPRMEQVREEHAEQQRHQRGGDEPQQRLAADAADRLGVAHAGDARHHGGEHQRRDDHLDQPQEDIREDREIAGDGRSRRRVGRELVGGPAGDDAGRCRREDPGGEPGTLRRSSVRGSGRRFHQNITFASNRPVVTATAVATMPGIMNEWLSTYLPIFVVPDRSKLIAAISEP